MTSILKMLSESPNLTSLPSTYNFSTHQNDYLSPDDDLHQHQQHDPIPTIDFSMLTSSTPHQHSQAIHHLARACTDWGFFKVINHGVPESLMNEMMSECERFFNLTDEEKKEFAGKDVLDPIRCGTSFNTSVEKVFCWRDFLKIFVHPQFHSPNKPPRFSEVSSEYCKRTRQVVKELLKGISESLGLEPDYIYNTQNMEEGVQVLISNLYPPCPEPELAMGIPPHSDHGLLTLLIQNGIDGLQLNHNGKWINVKATPNSFLVNTADQIQVLSNGKYKSVVHRAVVNSKNARMSLAIAHGPSFDTVVTPARELVDTGTNPQRYEGVKYKDYLYLQQSNQLDKKFCLDQIQIS